MRTSKSFRMLIAAEAYFEAEITWYSDLAGAH
jgi:hypothetical protein